MQDLSKYPPFQLILKEIDKSLEPIEVFIEKITEALPAAVLSLDYEFVRHANSESKNMLEIVQAYLQELEKAFKETELTLKILHEMGNKRDPFEMPIEIELAYADMTRPIFNRAKDIREIVALTDKLLT